MARLRSIIAVVLLVGSLIISGSLLLPIVIPLMFIPFCYPYFRRHTSRCMSIFQTFVGFLFEIVYGIKYTITGDKPFEGITICNHRTRLDWAMLWPLLTRAKAMSFLHIVLKASGIKGVPYLGYACHTARYIFLNRRWEQDEEHISAMCRVIGQQKSEPFNLLIFPEGTDLCAKSLEASNRFAAKFGLPCYEYVLHPRTRGLVHVARCLEGSNRGLQTIHDVTMGFRGPIPQTEMHFFDTEKMPMPTEVHVHTESFSLADLKTYKSNLKPVAATSPQSRLPSPSDITDTSAETSSASAGSEAQGAAHGARKDSVMSAEELEDRCIEQWTTDRFRIKEEALRLFYTGECTSLDAAVTRATASLTVTGAAPVTKKASAPADGSRDWKAFPAAEYLQVILVVLLLTIFTGSAFSRWPLYSTLYFLGYFLVYRVSKAIGGFDKLEVKLVDVKPQKAKAA